MNPEEPLEIRHYVRVLWRRRSLVIFACLGVAFLMFILSARRPPKFVASAKVFIGPRSVDRDDATGALQELAFSKEFVTSYAEQLRSRPLAERVVEQTGLAVSPVELASRVRTLIIPETRIIDVSVHDPQSHRAQLMVNSLVQTFVVDLERELGPRGGIRASVFESALEPSAPVGPKPIRDALLGGILGLALGVGAALLLELLDTRLRTRDDAERILDPLPILAGIPHVSVDGNDRGLFLERDPASAAAEAFRILRTNVQFLGVDKPIRTVLIVSPSPEDGKSTVAANLACSMAAAGYRTLYLEADLRRPVAHMIFGVPNAPGLSDLLVGRSTLEGAIRRTKIRNLLVLPAGFIPPNPAELLGSSRMSALLEQASSTIADFIVIDTPPALPLADANVLGPHVDGVILVVRLGRTHRHRAQELKSVFTRLGARVLGAVINDHRVADFTGAGYYYRHKQEQSAQASTRKSWEAPESATEKPTGAPPPR